MVFRDQLTLGDRANIWSRWPSAARRVRCVSVVLRGIGCTIPPTPGAELYAFYPLMSITHNRRFQLEVALPGRRSPCAVAVSVYPTTDWHERETYDFFGIFDGHPALTRIEMPDDWVGHPQRKDYPLGGVPVEYHGAQIPPPDERGPTTDGGGDGVITVLGGQDWDEIVAAGESGEASERHRRQHGAPAPVHPRRAAADPGDRGRDGHRAPVRNRLPAPGSRRTSSTAPGPRASRS